MGAGYSISGNLPTDGMTSTQRAQYNVTRDHYQQNYSTDALKRQGQQQLELAKITGQQNNPYYNAFRELARTGDMSSAVRIRQGWMDDQKVEEARRAASVAARIEGLQSPSTVSSRSSGRSSGSSSGSNSGSGSGMGMFLGGTTGVLPGYISPGQPLGSGMGMGMGMGMGAGVEPPTRFRPDFGLYASEERAYLNRGAKNKGGDNFKRKAALQSAYQKVLAAQNEGQPPTEGGGGADSGASGTLTPPSTTPAPTGTRTTAAMVDDKGYVYGMGAVPGYGYNPYAGMAPGQTSPALASFKQPTLTRQENKVLRRIGYTPEKMYVEAITPKTNYFSGQQMPSYGQPMVMNSPFAGQYPVLNSPFAGQPPMMMNQPFFGQPPITQNSSYGQNPMMYGQFDGKMFASGRPMSPTYRHRPYMTGEGMR